MFTNIITETTTSISAGGTILAIAIALVLGIVIAGIYALGGNASKYMLVSLTTLPAIVGVVILVVNGNLGVGIAVMGAFSLVRFRSLPGKSLDICYLFFAMAVGLVSGMGYVIFAAVITAVIGVVLLISSKLDIGIEKSENKRLKITIPEDLNYSNCFDDIFEKYTKSAKLVKVKTANMGMLYELNYQISLRDKSLEKNMIDDIRVRNGNLTVVCERFFDIEAL